jgi:biotin transport system substrate-specific component
MTPAHSIPSRRVRYHLSALDDPKESEMQQTLTLTDALMPKRSLGRDVLLVLAGSTLVALCARLSVHLPFSPVPVTGQTFGVLLVGALLGSRRGALSMLAYLGEGLAGLPVFAGGTAGIAALLGPSGGYLVGFVFAAFVTGWLAERGWDRRLGSAALAMLAGSIALYLPGLVWLAKFVGVSEVLGAGLLPFIPGDAVKLVLAALALPFAWKLLAKR